MIDSFYMNGDFWTVRFVNPTNRILVDRTGTLTIGVSDYGTRTVYLANNLYGEKLIECLFMNLGTALYSHTDFYHIFTEWLKSNIGLKQRSGYAILLPIILA